MELKYIFIVILAIALITQLPKPQLQAVIENQNIILNGDFSQGDLGWDMREGQGADGNPVGELDYEIYHNAPPSLKIVPSLPTNTGECDRTVWQEPRTSIAEYRGLELTLSAWVRHSDCTDGCGDVYPEYTGSDLVNWDCCEYENVCQMSRYVGLWCAISGRGGVRFGGDFYDYTNCNPDYNCMFKEYGITDDWVTSDNTWHYKEYKVVVPEDYHAPTGEGPFNADDVIIWVQGHPCESQGTLWMDDVSLTYKTQDCNTLADSNCDGIVTKNELIVQIQDYLNNILSRTELIPMIQGWLASG